ncbi:MAG TPA: hypothetical protein VL588_10160 [Bdellovibrionota bacterium]|jgi:glutathione synthase/RimK-type ligase-like ATP-grasp enzyme|nr:hypothetical protein [Bdellovibrionota bacterium]
MSQPKRIAFATCSEVPDLSDNDRLAVKELARLGIEAVPAIWSEPRDWRGFDAVILRSTWYYWLHYRRFLEWLELLEASGKPVWNPVPLLRWNTNKLYLKDLIGAGLPVVPTQWISPGDWKSVAEFSRSTAWDEVVVKPVVSGGAFSTFRLPGRGLESARAQFQEIWGFGPAMIQPFLKQILTEGEYSFLFYGGEFSHAVLKSAAPGDYRVQHIYGGTSRAVQVDRSWIQTAERIIDAVDTVPLYARVDMVRGEDGLLLMELELTEPNLFFGDQPGSAAMFAEKVLQQMTQGRFR